VTEITLPDGSKITGQATFLRSNGTTGTVADTVLVSTAEGHKVTQTVQVDGQGNRTVTSMGYDASGKLAFVMTSVTNATGTSITNSYDDTGDMVVDRIQTIVTTTDGNGVKTETRTNSAGSDAANDNQFWCRAA
jgi:hypothetical protein